MDFLKILSPNGCGRLSLYCGAVALYAACCAVNSRVQVGVLLKALPVLYLGAALRGRAQQPPKNSDQLRLCSYLSYGLFLSACGDALLELGHFEAGMGAFAGAQGLYWRAWGPQGHRLHRLVVALGAVAFGVWLNAPGVLQVGVPLYALVLALAVGRGVARGAGAHWRGGAAAGALGAALFGLSDALLGYAMFRAPLPYRTLWVMSTYYAAQYGIALAGL